MATEDQYFALRLMQFDGATFAPGEPVPLPADMARTLLAKQWVDTTPPGHTGPVPPATPPGRAHLIASAIIAVIAAGGATNEGLTSSGKPKIDALVNAGAPADVTAAERDAVTGDLLILGAAASDKNAAYLTPVPDAGPDTE